MTRTRVQKNILEEATLSKSGKDIELNSIKAGHNGHRCRSDYTFSSVKTDPNANTTERL